MKFLPALTLLLAPAAVSGFVAPSGSERSATALNMTPQEGLKKAALSVVAAAFLASNLAFVEPAMAVDEMNMDFGSSQVLAGRSGGRAGGRSAVRAAPRPSSSSSVRSSTVIQRTTYVPSPVIVAPPVYGYGYGYNPVPGLGLSIGLNAINQIGNDMRDYRQESEIAQTRAQLQNSQMREAEMEARLRQLEMASQNNQLTQQQQQQLMQIQMMNQQLQQAK